MEKPFNEQDNQLKHWMQELPMESPSPDFTHKVMERISAQSTVTQYQPLIPKTAWVFIVLGLLASMVWLYWNPSSSLLPGDSVSLIDKITWTNPFEKLNLSKTMVYALGFLALFLLQIPFLKRLHDRQFQ